MKLKAIEKICKAAKTVILWPTEDGRVFAGDGGAFYLLPDALSKISARDMLDVFDVPLDKQSDWSARECEPSERGEEMFADGGVAEDGAEPVEMTLGVGGDVLQPIGNAFEMHLVDEIYLKPLEDERSMCYFFLRHAGDTPYIAVKSGMMLHAVIMPKKIAPKVCGQMVQTITEAARTQTGLWEGDAHD